MIMKLLSADGRAVLNAIMRHVPSGLTLAAAPDGTILQVSDYGSQLVGRSRHELEGISVEDHAAAYRISDPRTGQPARSEDLPLGRAIKDGEIVRDEEWLVTNEAGDVIPILCNAGPIRDGKGVIIGGVIAWSDIRTQKALQNKLATMVEERDLLLHEIHHRVKNQLQIISSIVHMEAVRYGAPCQAFSESILRRLDVLAASHETSYRSGDYSSVNVTDHLQRVCDLLSSPDHPVVLITDSALRLTPDQATPVALIVNEAVSNALKHAFPDGRRGHVKVVLKREDQQFVLSVIDDGVGFQPKATTETLGLTLVDRLSRQLGGECSLRKGADGGTVLTLRFPSG